MCSVLFEHNLKIYWKEITLFIYHDVYLLAGFSKRKCWTKIVHPNQLNLLLFSLSFRVLIITHKCFVESRYAIEKKAQEVVNIILDNQFCNDSYVIVHIVWPFEMTLQHVYDFDIKIILVFNILILNKILKINIMTLCEWIRIIFYNYLEIHSHVCGSSCLTKIGWLMVWETKWKIIFH